MASEYRGSMPPTSFQADGVKKRLSSLLSKMSSGTLSSQDFMVRLGQTSDCSLSVSSLAPHKFNNETHLEGSNQSKDVAARTERDRATVKYDISTLTPSSSMSQNIEHLTKQMLKIRENLAPELEASLSNSINQLSLACQRNLSWPIVSSLITSVSLDYLKALECTLCLMPSDRELEELTVRTKDFFDELCKIRLQLESLEASQIKNGSLPTWEAHFLEEWKKLSIAYGSWSDKFDTFVSTIESDAIERFMNHGRGTRSAEMLTSWDQDDQMVITMGLLEPDAQVKYVANATSNFLQQVGQANARIQHLLQSCEELEQQGVNLSTRLFSSLEMDHIHLSPSRKWSTIGTLMTTQLDEASLSDWDSCLRNR